MSYGVVPGSLEMQSLRSDLSRLNVKMAQMRLKSYPYCVEQLKLLDAWFEGITSPDSFGGSVVDVSYVNAIQEQVLLMKERHPEYNRLQHRVEKTSAILKLFPKIEQDVVDLWHFKKIDEYVICGMLDVSRRTFFRHKARAERRFALCWEFYPLEDLTSEKVKKMTLEVSG